MSTISTDGLWLKGHGATTDSKPASSTDLERVTYEKLFYHIPKRKSLAGGGQSGQGKSQDSRHTPDTVSADSNRTPYGAYKGFPLTVGSWCKKLKPGAEYLRIPTQHRRVVSPTQDGTVHAEFSDSAPVQGAKTNIVQYLGIAADEPERIARHTKPGFLLPLVEIGWDEAYCRKWCEENELLSPIYTTATRGGCWFCHNQGIEQLRLLRKNYPDLWTMLLKWDLDSPVTFKSDGHTVHDFDKRFALEDAGLLTPGDRRFRWRMIKELEAQHHGHNIAISKEGNA